MQPRDELICILHAVFQFINFKHLGARLNSMQPLHYIYGARDFGRSLYGIRIARHGILRISVPKTENRAHVHKLSISGSVPVPYRA